MRKVHRGATLFRELAAKALNRRNQAKIVENGGVQFVRQGLYIAGEVGALLPDLLQLIASGHLPKAPTFGHFLNSEREHGEPLANVVVQFSGDVAPFFFLGGDQLAAHLFQLTSRASF